MVVMNIQDLEEILGEMSVVYNDGTEEVLTLEKIKELLNIKT